MKAFFALVCVLLVVVVAAVHAGDEEMGMRAVRRRRNVDHPSGVVAQMRMNVDGSAPLMDVSAAQLRARRDLCSQACTCDRRRRTVVEQVAQIGEGVVVRQRRQVPHEDACRTECVCTAK